MKRAGFKRITCVLYRGGSGKVIRALHGMGLNTTAVIHARGSAIGDPVNRNGLPAQFEKEVFSVIVEAGRADEVFQSVFDLAEIDRPYGGFLYMEKLAGCTDYQIPDVPDES